MTVSIHPQGSAEWFQERRGVPSASNFDKIITSTGKRSTQRTKYMYQLAGEKLGAITEESYQSFAMTRGIEMEAEARKLYEIAREPVTLCGFFYVDGYGASPDGTIGEDGILEIKCPLLSTHIEYLLKDEIPTDYYQQTQGQLLVTGRKWVDFMSYFPGLKPLIVRETPDDVFQLLLKTELDLFCEDLEKLVKQLTK